MIQLPVRHHKQLCSHRGKGGRGRSEQAAGWMGKSEATTTWENGMRNHSQGYSVCTALPRPPHLKSCPWVWKGTQARGWRLFRHSWFAEGVVLETALSYSWLPNTCSSWRGPGEEGFSPSTPPGFPFCVQTFCLNTCSSAPLNLGFSQ